MLGLYSSLISVQVSHTFGLREELMQCQCCLDALVRPTLVNLLCTFSAVQASFMKNINLLGYLP